MQSFYVCEPDNYKSESFCCHKTSSNKEVNFQKEKKTTF
uniref:Uncharacterized protein n=1 Tax=Rhizophora mucronata TaxID=61149 RepID=A0A2P2N403_RHIMU